MENLTPFEVVASILCAASLLVTVVDFVIEFYIKPTR